MTFFSNSRSLASGKRSDDSIETSSGGRRAGDDSLPCWCGRDEWVLCFRTSKFGLLRCRECACYRIDPPSLKSDGESADFYSDYYRSHPKTTTRLTDPAVSRTGDYWKIAQSYPALRRIGRTAIDIGCGDGHFCAELKSAGWKSVTGLDVSSTRITTARRLYPDISFLNASLDQLTISHSSVDLIVMEHVIEHFVNPLDVLKKARSLLAPTGYLLVTTPNMSSGHFRLLGRRWTGMLAPDAHIFLFAPETLRRILCAAGLSVDTVGSFHWPRYGISDCCKPLASGDVKTPLWRSHQELGALYGRLINAGPMLYGVGHRPNAEPYP